MFGRVFYSSEQVFPVAKSPSGADRRARFEGAPVVIIIKNVNVVGDIGQRFPEANLEWWSLLKEPYKVWSQAQMDGSSRMNVDVWEP